MVALKTVPHVVDVDMFALVKPEVMVRLQGLARRYIPAHIIRIKRQPALDKFALLVVADQGHASIARAEGIIHDRLVNLSIDARFHCEAVSTFVEGVRDLGVGRIDDRAVEGH